MKKILFICAMVLLGTIGLSAQERGNRGDMQERMRQRVENYIKELGLKDKKATDFKKIYDESQAQMRKEMESMRESGNPDREAMRAKTEKLNSDRDAKIKKILSAEEYKKYESLVKAEQERGRQGGGRGGSR